MTRGSPRPLGGGFVDFHDFGDLGHREIFGVCGEGAIDDLLILNWHELMKHVHWDFMFTQVGEELFASCKNFRVTHIIANAVRITVFARKCDFLFASVIMIFSILRISKHYLIANCNKIRTFIFIY